MAGGFASLLGTVRLDDSNPLTHRNYVAALSPGPSRRTSPAVTQVVVRCKAVPPCPDELEHAVAIIGADTDVPKVVQRALEAKDNPHVADRTVAERSSGTFLIWTWPPREHLYIMDTASS